jgi:L-fuconolactonase
MPIESIVDTHVHLWDPRVLRYPWLDDNRMLNRPFLLDDYKAATAALTIEAMVFVQCEADFSSFDAEADWVATLAAMEPRIKGLVAWAPLEKGASVLEDLARLKRHSILRGIRRIIQFEPDLNFCLRDDFVAGLRTLAAFDLSFDICVDHRHMGNVVKLVERVPEVRMVLDHIGKPAIKDGSMHPWIDHLRELANFPNVFCKISGVATEADHQRWAGDELKRYAGAAIDAFGFDRIMFGGDWPVSIQAIEFHRWVEIVDELLTGVSQNEQRKFWRDNATRFYRI